MSEDGTGKGAPRTGRVKKTSISLSEELYDWANEQVENKRYHTRSHLIDVAVAELRGRREGYDLAASSVDGIKNAALEAIERVQKAAISNEYSMSILLTLAARHPELIEEINDLMRAQKSDNITTYRKVIFK